MDKADRKVNSLRSTSDIFTSAAKFDHEFSGGPFTAIAYCWDQALQYFPQNLRKKREKWFYKKEFKSLLKCEFDFNRIDILAKIAASVFA